MSTQPIVPDDGTPAADASEPAPEPSEHADTLAESDEGGFRVRLDNFTGPFDLLLQLIGKRKLDVTEVALHVVTDDFIAYIRALGDGWDLDEVSEFLVVASTLLDLKAARLLPAAVVEDEEDLALLEARDLLFARLLQYKAYKEAAAHLAGLEAAGLRRFPRAVALEPQFAEALPDLVLGVGPQRLVALAAKAMRPKTPPAVPLAHVHQERVSVREHAARLRDVLMRAGTATFRALVADCRSTLEVVARFLALLELYREGLVGFDQVQPLGDLTVRWTGPTDGDIELDIDEFEGVPEAPADQAAADQPAAQPAESMIAPAGTGEGSDASDNPADAPDDVIMEEGLGSSDAVAVSDTPESSDNTEDPVPAGQSGEKDQEPAQREEDLT